MQKIARAAALLAVALYLSACAGLEIEEGRKLAATGVEASAALSSAAADSKSGLAAKDRYDGMRNIIGGTPYSTPSELAEKLKEETQILDARIKMTKELGNAYGAFQKLAKPDAGATFYFTIVGQALA